MFRIFLDTNVALDLIANREPFVQDSLPFLELVKKGEARLFISEDSIGTIVYMAVDRLKLVNAEEKLIQFFDFGNIITGGKEVLLNSLNSDFKDKEDAIQYFTAIENDMDFFITRDKNGFNTADGRIPILTPKEFFEN
ncbi:type II toxin-antitoxin system VapC family toxin [Algoriphagus mannitolivorans]|uniref:type II toxin-antitoxin system VapC family toxin n=1 Tax=Algoriphagus mannitolivorans TaxID=226504 RepID=UPI00042893CE|nr:PIN domain-containing protein [Algoriphagus mannitolivorans]